jgi:hypothetical protein
MDLLELLRSQARRYKCPVCGENMADCGITILDQKGSRALVRVTCASCNDENLLQIVLQGEAASAAKRRKPTIDEGIPEIPDPIATDELLDVHAALSEWDGDISTLLKR